VSLKHFFVFLHLFVCDPRRILREAKNIGDGVPNPSACEK
jgi:hypothetical protein